MTNLEEYSIPIFIEIDEEDLDLVDSIIEELIYSKDISILVANLVLAKVGLAKQSLLDDIDKVNGSL